ncbi:MAG TPA: MOSC N-terminal beta barrel domain-containing protein, partial [Pseudonocardiaceae bacterium]|nr:MOSC N-terminal beta barrel domain-containing protein [Pseudonocardiaceae bacterium]
MGPGVGPGSAEVLMVFSRTLVPAGGVDDQAPRPHRTRFPINLASVALALTGVNRYPIKSCRGHALEEAVVEPWGLAGDRRWMLVDDNGLVVT